MHLQVLADFTPESLLVVAGPGIHHSATCGVDTAGLSLLLIREEQE